MKLCKCLRCGYEWVTRMETLPIKCANEKCKSPYWNIPRKQKKQIKYENVEKNYEIYNEDCFKIFPSIEDGSVDLILADLPYGVTACSWDSVLPLDKLWEEYKRIIKSNGAIVLTATQPFTWKLCSSNPYMFKYDIIWEKPNGTNPLLIKKQPFKVHESLLVFYNKQPTYNPQMTYGSSKYKSYENEDKTLGEVFSGSKEKKQSLISLHRANTDGSRYPRSVIRCPQDRSGHPTKKPVALMSWIINTYTNMGETVLDNTMGEGTTGVASIINNRKFIGMEISKQYFEVAQNSMDNISEKVIQNGRL